MIEFRGVGRTYASLLAPVAERVGPVLGRRLGPLLGRRVRAVDDLTLTISRGEVFGLAGPNGAGKSTLISMLLGYLEPTDGQLTIDGLAPRAFVQQHGIGYLSELINIPPRWKLEHALTRYALLAGVPATAIRARVEQSIRLLGLDEHRGKRVKQLSKGNLQRLGLAQALLHDEEVLILDEPTHGLDPVWTQRFRDLVTALRRDDRVIFIASHNLDELQRLADRVAIMDHGRLQRVVDPRAIGAGERVPYRLVLASGDDLVRASFPGAVLVGPGDVALPAIDVESLNAGLARLLAAGGRVRSVTPAHSALEQQFREAVRDPQGGGAPGRSS